MAKAMPTFCAIFLCASLLSLMVMCEGAPVRGGRRRQQLIRNILRRVNKPAVKTIKSEDGDIIDCVDIYKQPAFDHPLLRNHTLQMRPKQKPSYLQAMENRRAGSPPLSQVWHRSGGCPRGTIPIRRIQKSHLLATPTHALLRFGKRPPRHGIMAPSSSREEMAGARILNTKKLPNGIGGTMSIWRPDIVLPSEYSLSSISVGSFVDVDHNAAEVGYGINRPFYSDNYTRFYIYWTKDAGRSTGCFDLACSGFVQTSEQIVIGGVIPPASISIYNQSIMESSFVIHMDKEKSKWWLNVEGTDVGYWPEPIFTQLKESTYLHWGGFVLNQRAGGTHTTTQMGSGHYAKEAGLKVASMRNMIGINFYYNMERPDPGEFTPFQSEYGCYTVVPTGQSSEKPYGYQMFYGGPGGPQCNLVD